MPKETVSFKCPKMVKYMLAELTEIDQDNRSQVIIQAIREYYQKRITDKAVNQELDR